MSVVKRIYVHTGNLHENNKDNKRRPVMICDVWKNDRLKGKYVCFDIEITGSSRMIYDTFKEAIGTYVYMETTSRVVLLLEDGTTIAV